MTFAAYQVAYESAIAFGMRTRLHSAVHHTGLITQRTELSEDIARLKAELATVETKCKQVQSDAAATRADDVSVHHLHSRFHSLLQQLFVCRCGWGTNCVCNVRGLYSTYNMLTTGRIYSSPSTPRRLERCSKCRTPGCVTSRPISHPRRNETSRIMLLIRNRSNGVSPFQKCNLKIFCQRQFLTINRPRNTSMATPVII
jgi:hypothetical protein